MNLAHLSPFSGRLAKSVRGLATLATIAAAVAGATGAMAETDGRAPVTPVAEKLTRTSASGEDQTTRSLNKQVYLGRAPWICTPSGFGQTTRCFQR